MTRRFRRDFSKPTKRAALHRSGGHCEAVGHRYGLPRKRRCNAPLALGVEFDHGVTDADGGGNGLENCVAVCVRCHKFKSDKIDKPAIAKRKRVKDRHLGIVRPQGAIKSAKRPKAKKPAKAFVKMMPAIARRYMETAK